ncbi:hypothetical protein ACIFQM_12840 [Paenibacillus sp. NRS-1782]|uniref:hypothetical protein n=1 Tax=unclassified Paenibacillus TaxID=185978 RepID=UPI003D2DFFD6
MSNNQHITQVEFTDFTLFSSVRIPFARHINIISGETGAGKTNVLKALYSYGKTINEVKGLPDSVSLERISEMIASKLLGVFRPDDRKIGRLYKLN